MQRFDVLEELKIQADRFRNETNPELKKLYMLAVDRLLDEYGVIDPSKPVPPSEEVQWHVDGINSD